MTETFTLQTIVSARDDVLASGLSETEMVMMNIDKGFYYGLEEVGKTIWDAMAEPQSVDTLCDAVLSNYDEVDRETVEADIFAFLGQLSREELVLVHDGHEQTLTA